MKIDNIYTSFSFSKIYKAKLINFLRNNTTIETGGNKVFDGTYNHLLHIPEEFAELIIELKKIHKKDKVFKNFLEIGFSHGIANTILNKFFNFEKHFFYFLGCIFSIKNYFLNFIFLKFNLGSGIYLVYTNNSILTNTYIF